jgi:hypothetical protein
MSVAMETTPHATGKCDDIRLNVWVIFTSEEATITAMSLAASLAKGWQARLTLVVAQPVPFPRQLVDPPVSIEFNEKRYHLLAKRSPVQTNVRVYLCRDRLETLRSILPPGSLVVIGGKERWWPTAERRLAAAIRRAGHDVVLAKAE